MKKRLYLTFEETERIIQSTRDSVSEMRDRSMIMTGFYHGLRVSELTGLTLSDVDLSGGRISIRRLKSGFSTVHPLVPKEQRFLEAWMKLRPLSAGEWLYPSLKGQRLSRQYIYKLLRRYGERAGLTLQVHPHMLRHACGYGLAEQGMDTRLIQDYLGHRNIRHTVHYTAGNVARFARTWATEDEDAGTCDDGKVPANAY